MSRDHETPVADVSAQTESTRSPWLTVREAAERAKCHANFIYAAIKRGKLRAARLGVRKDLRIHETWVDAWLTSAIVVNGDAPGADLPPPTPFGRRR